ncbi:MAG: DUF4268 domain-containing protein, partial [bacterium]
TVTGLVGHEYAKLPASSTTIRSIPSGAIFMNSKISLGRLERVDLRDCWEREDAGFTPWLAEEENISILSGVIGMELEAQEEEASVGPFRADILCKDSDTDELVIIENQLERTNHTHLGQILVYAAGLDAVTVVWVAERFTEEHRAMMDWMNRITDEGFSFFGLEIEVWRIGESEPAPKFNLIAKPNQWSKSVKEATRSGTLTPSVTNRIAYWTAFDEYLESQNTRFKPPKPTSMIWKGFGIGRTGAGLSIALKVDQIFVAVLTDNWAHPTWYYKLESQRSEIEAETGFALEWDVRADKKHSRIGVRLDIDTQDENNWPEIHDWMYAKMNALETVMRPRVVPLDDEPVPDEDN